MSDLHRVRTRLKREVDTSSDMLLTLTSVAVVCRAHTEVDGIDAVVRLIDAFLDPAPCWTLPEATEKVSAGRLRLLKRVAANDPADMEPLFKHERFSSALVHAVRLGDQCVVEWLVDQYLPTGRIGQSVNEAATSGQLGILQWLVERHASRIIWSGDELLEAVKRNDSVMTRWLIEHSGGYYGFDESDMGLFLEFMAKHGDLEMVKWVCEHCRAYGVPISIDTLEKLFYWIGVVGRDDLMEYVTEQFGCPDWHKCLEGAIHGGHLELAKKVQERYGVRRVEAICLYEPASCGRIELFEWTLSNCTLVDESTLESVVASAAGKGHLDIVQCICEKLGIRYATHAVKSAAKNGRLEVLKWVHENSSDPWSYYAMDEAALQGHLDVVKWLHENRSDGCSYMAICGAAEHGHLEVVKWLYRNKPKHVTTYGEGRSLTLSAMEGAASCGHFEVVKWLHYHSPHIDSTSVMDKAVTHGDLEMVKWLHEKQYRCSEDVIDEASRIGRLELVKWLHSNCGKGCSPIAFHNAAKGGHTRVFNWLICNKPDQFVPNGELLKAAVSGGSFEILLFVNQLVKGQFEPTVDLFDEARLKKRYEVLEWFTREYAHAMPQLQQWLRDKSRCDLYLADIAKRYGYSWAFRLRRSA